MPGMGKGRGGEAAMLYAIRLGWRREDDTPSPRILAGELPSGVAHEVGLTRAELDLMVGPDALGRRRGAQPVMSAPAPT